MILNQGSSSAQILNNSRGHALALTVQRVSLDRDSEAIAKCEVKCIMIIACM